MVKFSALPTLLWMVIPFFIIASYTEGKNYRGTVIPSHGMHELNEEHRSILAKVLKAPGIIRRKRSAPDVLSVAKLKMTSLNDTGLRLNRSVATESVLDLKKINFAYNSNATFEGNVEEEQKEILGCSQGGELTNVNDQYPIILNDSIEFGNNKASGFEQFSDFSRIVTSNYSSVNENGNERIRNLRDQRFNTSTTVSPAVQKKATISNDSLNPTTRETRTISSPDNSNRDGLLISDGTNRSVESDHILQNATTRRLSLLNLDQPVISQDAEILEDDGLRNSNHIRVKRGFYDPDSDTGLGEIRNGDLREEKISYFQDDDRSNVKNELVDMYPDPIDDPLHPSSYVELIRKKRLNYEMLFPRSYLKANYETRSSKIEPEVSDGYEERKGNADYFADPRETNGPVFLESFSNYENSPGSLLMNPAELFASHRQPKTKAKTREESLEKDSLVNVKNDFHGLHEPKTDLIKGTSEIFDSASDPTTVESLDFILNNLPIDYRQSISKSDKNEILNRYSKLRRKRDVPLGFRTSRKGSGNKKHDKSQKVKHRKKHKKKRKKVKKPSTNSEDEKLSGLYPRVLAVSENHAAPMKEDLNLVSKLQNEYGALNKREISRLVDELQVEAHVEKRDSGDARSEIDINKREISKNDETQNFRDKRTIDYQKNSSPVTVGPVVSEKINGKGKANKNHDDFRPRSCSNEELRYYDDVHEPNLQAQRNDIEMKPNPFDKVRKERTAKSVEQIRDLVERLIDRVDELEEYVSTVDNQRRKRGKNKAKEDFSNSTMSIDGRDSKNLTKDADSEVCAGQTDTSESKLEVERNERAGNEGKEKTVERPNERKRSAKILRRYREASRRCRKRQRSHRKWDRWTDWSSCSVTCGKGRQIRWRHCIHDCTTAETEMEEKSCQLPACGPGKFLGIF